MKLKRLKVDTWICIAIAASVFISLFISTVFIPEDYLIWASALLMAIAYLAVAMFIKKRSIHSYNKRTVALILATSAILYITLYYFAGLKFGFSSSLKGVLTFNSFVKNVVPVTLIIVATEFIRELLVAQKSNLVFILSYAIGVVSDIAAAGGFSYVNSSYSFSDFIGMTLFPAFTANILYTYISKNTVDRKSVV